MKRVRLGNAKRLLLDYYPTWEGAIEGYTINFVRSNLWRLDSNYERDDILQECYIKFLELVERYPRVVDPPHFMSLYKSAIRNHVFRLAERRPARYECSEASVSSGNEDEGRTVYEITADPKANSQTQVVEIKMLLEQAPEPIKRLLPYLLAPSEERPVCLRDDLGRRETTNELWAHLAGVDLTVDMRQMMNNWLGGVPQ